MKVYGCKYCGTIMTSKDRPSSSGCPSPIQSSHDWTDLAKIGNKIYSCKYCGAVASCDSIPLSSGCPSPIQSSHNWIHSGEGFGNFRSATNIKTKKNNLEKKEDVFQSEETNNKSKEQPNVDFKDTLVGGGMISMGKGLKNVSNDLEKRSKSRKKAEKIELDEKINDITSIEFKSTAGEVQQQIEELIIQGISMSAKHLSARKAAYSKVMIGISRLKSSGEIQTASALEEQAKELKPKIWHIIANFLE